MMMAWQSTPHFLFGLAEKKTGRGRSKRKERLAQNLHVRAGLLNTEVFRIGSDKDRMVFYRLAPDYSLARVLRRDCRSGRDLGVLVERPVLLAPLARYPGNRWGLGYRGRTGNLANRQGSASGKRRERYPGPPGGFLRTPTRGQGVFRLPQVRRVAVGDCPGLASTHLGQPPYLSQLARRCKFGAQRFFLLDRPRPVFFLSRTKRKWGVDCQASNLASALVPSDAPSAKTLHSPTGTMPGNSSHAAAKASPSNPVS